MEAQRVQQKRYGYFLVSSTGNKERINIVTSGFCQSSFIFFSEYIVLINLTKQTNKILFGPTLNII